VKLLLLSAALLLAQADAGVAERRVKITVRAIAASNDAAIPAGTDPKLKPIGPQLESFGEQFRFRSYRLIDERSFDLDWKNAASTPTGRSRSTSSCSGSTRRIRASSTPTTPSSAVARSWWAASASTRATRRRASC